MSRVDDGVRCHHRCAAIYDWRAGAVFERGREAHGCAFDAPRDRVVYLVRHEIFFDAPGFTSGKSIAKGDDVEHVSVDESGTVYVLSRFRVRSILADGQAARDASLPFVASEAVLIGKRALVIADWGDAYETDDAGARWANRPRFPHCRRRRTGARSGLRGWPLQRHGSRADRAPRRRLS